MEEACFKGDLFAARKCFESLFRYEDEANDTIAIDMVPGASDIIHRCLCLAAANGQLSTFGFLLDQGAPITREVIKAVCDADRIEVLEAMVRHAWDVNQRKGGTPPLRDALSSVPCTRWLLENGADPNPPDSHLLAYAAAFESVDIVQLLVKHGANVRGTMAVHAAAASCAKLAEDNTYVTDLDRLKVLQILLDHGADVNEMEEDPKWRKNRRQRTCFTGTPLHHMVQHGSLEAVQFLLSRGADPLHPSWSGHTVLQAAERAGRTDMVELLRCHLQYANQ